jgi:hypothetical protein
MLVQQMESNEVISSDKVFHHASRYQYASLIAGGFEKDNINQTKLFQVIKFNQN